MLFVLSPAKTLDESPVAPSAPKATTPIFAAEADTLAGALACLPLETLRTVLGVSPPLASLNHRRYTNWSSAKTKQAVFAFDGPAYKALDAGTLSAEQLAYVQAHLRVLCGLYGIVRPLDGLKPYRLEMGTKLKGTKLKEADLYAFWGDRVAKAVRDSVAEMPSGTKCIVNVASQEYYAVIKPHLAAIGTPVVTCVFPGATVYAKAARGGIVRYAAVTGAKTPADLRGFTGASGEWRFVPGQSTDNELVFHRGGGGPSKAPAKRVAAAADDDEGEDGAAVAKKPARRRT